MKEGTDSQSRSGTAAAASWTLEVKTSTDQAESTYRISADDKDVCKISSEGLQKPLYVSVENTAGAHREWGTQVLIQLENDSTLYHGHVRTGGNKHNCFARWIPDGHNPSFQCFIVWRDEQTLIPLQEVGSWTAG